MLYVYRPSVSESANELAESFQINARRLKDLGQAHYGKGVRSGDIVVCWGVAAPQVPDGVRVLNGAEVPNKFEAAQRLKAAGVPTVEVSRTRPATTPTHDVIDLTRYGQVNRQQATEVGNLITRFLASPIPQAQIWLPRRNNHVGGSDLLRPPTTPDYYSRKENITEEYRLHIFRGKSIRAGVKRVREGFEDRAHEFVRSYDAGWGLRYEGFNSTKKMRAVAVKAVETLGLDFGAVDLGQTADGTLLVLEVNRAPGVEGNTAPTYAQAIERWIQNGDTE